MYVCLCVDRSSYTYVRTTYLICGYVYKTEVETISNRCLASDIAPQRIYRIYIELFDYHISILWCFGAAMSQSGTIALSLPRLHSAEKHHYVSSTPHPSSPLLLLPSWCPSWFLWTARTHQQCNTFIKRVLWLREERREGRRVSMKKRVAW